MAAAQQVSAPRTGTIIGTVLDVNSDVVPNASIILESPAPADVQRVTTQDNGFFKLQGVKPGIPYRVTGTQDCANWTGNPLCLLGLNLFDRELLRRDNGDGKICDGVPPSGQCLNVGTLPRELSRSKPFQ